MTQDGDGYTVSSKCYNSRLVSCQCLRLPFLLRHGPQDAVPTLSLLTFNSDSLTPCSSSPCQADEADQSGSSRDHPSYYLVAGGDGASGESKT